MMEDRFCKSCQYVDVSNTFVQKMLEKAVKKGEDFVSERQLEERLLQCDGCPSLKYSSTCMHSGSLVGYRARLSRQTCPHPDGDKWAIV